MQELHAKLTPICILRDKERRIGCSEPVQTEDSAVSTTTERGNRHVRTAVAVLLLLAIAAGCSNGDARTDEPLVIGGIPDQDLELLEERFDGLASYLAEELDLEVVYRPSVDYTAIVTAFGNGDIQLGWFGALTGVQAQLETPGSRVLAQRPLDADFVSTFIVGAEVEADELDDLAGIAFTFGSEGSTSGHVMPRYFLQEAGVVPEDDFEQVGYSGAHDLTYRLVESGSYDAGVVSTEVWERAVREGDIDPARVRELMTTPPYANYHWLAHPDLDERFGEGTGDRLLEALLAAGDDPDAAPYVRMFEDDRFIESSADAFGPLEEIARDLGLLGG
jgi:phosphonate transport system substrate-binding protein